MRAYRFDVEPMLFGVEFENVPSAETDASDDLVLVGYLLALVDVNI